MYAVCSSAEMFSVNIFNELLHILWIEVDNTEWLALFSIF